MQILALLARILLYLMNVPLNEFYLFLLYHFHHWLQ